MSQTWPIVILIVLGVLILVGIILCISIMKGMYRSAEAQKGKKKAPTATKEIQEEIEPIEEEVETDIEVNDDDE